MEYLEVTNITTRDLKCEDRDRRGGQSDVMEERLNPLLLALKTEEGNHAPWRVGGLPKWKKVREQVLLQPPERNTTLLTPGSDSREIRVVFRTYRALK